MVWLPPGGLIKEVVGRAARQALAGLRLAGRRPLLPVAAASCTSESYHFSVDLHLLADNLHRKAQPELDLDFAIVVFA